MEHTDRQTDKQTDKQTDRRTDRLTLNFINIDIYVSSYFRIGNAILSMVNFMVVFIFKADLKLTEPEK